MAALNLDNLRLFTLGDPDLEREILGLFVENAWLYLAQIEEGKDWRRAAHSLKGSARGVGADDVAEAAERVEKTDAAAPVPIDNDLAPLKQALAAVAAVIASHLEQLDSPD